MVPEEVRFVCSYSSTFPGAVSLFSVVPFRRYHYASGNFDASIFPQRENLSYADANLYLGELNSLFSRASKPIGYSQGASFSCPIILGYAFAVDFFLHHEKPTTWAGVEPAKDGYRRPATNHYATQPAIYEL
ncbi:hypothetical protein TNCV_3305731 [Trichonephila clavipes]|nr:hypothetical protein TNCV_3305731 [Trichonephila clavipes]